MRIVTTAAALLAAAALAACSSSSNGDSTTAPSSPAGSASVSSPTQPSSSTGSSPTTFPSSTESAPAGGGLTQAQATAALLTAAQVGGSFTAAAPDDSDTALPCTPNEPPLSTQFPPDVKAEGDFNGPGNKSFFSEEIETYADEAAVAKVVAAGEKGLSCGTAKLGATTAKITGPTNLTSDLSTTVDKAEGWSVASTAANASLIIAQLGQHLVVFSFAADPSVDTKTLPNAEAIVNAGLAKVAAALK